MKHFETELDLGLLRTGTLAGGITDALIMEKDTSGNFKESHIIRTDRDWQISINWALRGTMLDSPFLDVPGTWVLKAYLEGWGKESEEIDREGDTVGGIKVEPAQTIVPAGAILPGDPPETEWQYAETFTFRAGKVLPGTYKMALTINYIDENGNPGPMAGFIELKDMVQIYKPA